MLGVSLFGGEGGDTFWGDSSTRLRKEKAKLASTLVARNHHSTRPSGPKGSLPFAAGVRGGGRLQPIYFPTKGHLDWGKL